MFSSQKEIALMIVFGIVAIASGADLVADFAHGADYGHVVKEAVIVVISLFALVSLLLWFYRQKKEIIALRQQLANVNNTTQTPKKYVLEVRKELANVVSQQFSEWMLTGSEVEVGWLLLKGLSLKEIAIVRNTQEKTVRQQASSIYKKAGVNGRHAFSAWFIEDIL